MVTDVTNHPLRVQTAWDSDLDVSLEDDDWTHVRALTKTVSSKARFGLIHYNFLHQIYMTPLLLHRTTRTWFKECPRCGLSRADFLHMAWRCPQTRDEDSTQSQTQNNGSIIQILAAIVQKMDAIPQDMNTLKADMRKVNKRSLETELTAAGITTELGKLRTTVSTLIDKAAYLNVGVEDTEGCASWTAQDVSVMEQFLEGWLQALISLEAISQPLIIERAHKNLPPGPSLGDRRGQ
ncbi:hypothetical protein NDU88_005040 [Pleurodeles waltl]|uniref:Uncharacterized protein n=1 Tax=Pleurodeles waltl TaxID=8319 RepID=A0AAV7TW46_PLEWA|nr:hypothetical protein NDU88_005040 [Pleurodeles waltl]